MSGKARIAPVNVDYGFSLAGVSIISWNAKTIGSELGAAAPKGIFSFNEQQGTLTLRDVTLEADAQVGLDVHSNSSLRTLELVGANRLASKVHGSQLGANLTIKGDGILSCAVDQHGGVLVKDVVLTLDEHCNVQIVAAQRGIMGSDAGEDLGAVNFKHAHLSAGGRGGGDAASTPGVRCDHVWFHGAGKCGVFG